MQTVTITLPDVVKFFTKDNRQLATLSFADMNERGVLESFLSGEDGALVKALRIPAMNAYNSAGANGTEAEKSAALNKRLAAWANGEWAIVERGEGIMTVYRDEVFVPLCLEQGLTMKEADSLIRDKVRERFPKDTKATFANFLEATAIERADEFGGDVAAARAAIEAFYESELATRRAAREKAGSKVAMPKIDLGAFKKTAKGK